MRVRREIPEYQLRGYVGTYPSKHSGDTPGDIRQYILWALHGDISEYILWALHGDISEYD